MSSRRGRSKSTKSASASAPPAEPRRKPDSYRRTRALKRHPAYEPITDEHLRYMWAAYKRGVFKSIENRIPADLDAAGFKKFFLAFVGWVLGNGGEVFVVMVPPKASGTLDDLPHSIPGALVTAHLNDPYMEPHCHWFPEASPRMRLESALRFLIDMKARYKLLICAPHPDWTFFDHICKYGVLRTIGKYRNFFPDGGDAMLFQGVN